MSGFERGIHACVMMTVFLFCILLFGCRAEPARAGIVPYDTVPPFSAETGDGETFQYPRDVQGKVVFLNFWASWCPECKVELPALEKIARRLRDEPFVVLAVNTDRKRRVMKKYLKKQPVDLPILYDGGQELLKAFGPLGLPASYLIGPRGEVHKLYLGFTPESMERYMQDIQALLKTLPRDPVPAPTAAETGPTDEGQEGLLSGSATRDASGESGEKLLYKIEEFEYFPCCGR